MRQADVEFSVRTDLALEERERIRGSESGIPGIRVQEREKKEGKIRVTEVAVCDERGAAAMGKPVGLYLTLEAPSLAKKDEDYHRDVSEELAELLRKLFEELLCLCRLTKLLRQSAQHRRAHTDDGIGVNRRYQSTVKCFIVQVLQGKQPRQKV